MSKSPKIADPKSEIPYKLILTQTQYKYYLSYFVDGKSLGEISVEYDVDVSTVCRVLKSARRRIIDYMAENPKK